MNISEDFIREYRAFRGWPPDMSVHIYVDNELTPLYPVALYRMGETLVIGVTEMLKDARQTLRDVKPDITIDEVIAMLFNGVTHKEDRSGFYILPECKPLESPKSELTIMPLTRAHKREVKKFLSHCSNRDKELGQVSLTDPCATGGFLGDELVAVSSFWFWGDKIADVGVLTHPNYRNKGYGTAVVSALLKESTRLDKWPLYRCDDWNTHSIALCTSLGFERVFYVEGAVVTYPKRNS